MVAVAQQIDGEPDSQRYACLTIDMEPDLCCAEQRIRLLDTDAYFESFVHVLQQEQIPLTSFTVMSSAARHIDGLNALAAALKIEFAVHSYSHDTSNPASEYEVRSAREAFGEIWNAQPLGYRAPNCLIDRAGVETLAAEGFRYDSSIVPSLRLDGYAYNNLRFDRTPFEFVAPSGTLLELPVACLAGVRLPFIFSYVKLLGLGGYRAALAACPLPETVVMYLHPYDLYAFELATNIPGWKRYAHLRNSRRAFSILQDIITLLKSRGYKFVLMQDLADRASRRSLPRYATAAM